MTSLSTDPPQTVALGSWTSSKKGSVHPTTECNLEAQPPALGPGKPASFHFGTRAHTWRSSLLPSTLVRCSQVGFSCEDTWPFQRLRGLPRHEACGTHWTLVMNSLLLWEKLCSPDPVVLWETVTLFPLAHAPRLYLQD